MPNRLLTSLYQYSEKDQRRFMRAFEDLSLSLHEKAAFLQQTEAWLRKGVNAPTAMESASGWHKQIAEVVVEGDAGGVCIARMCPALSRRARKGVDLDVWKPPGNSK